MLLIQKFNMKKEGATLKKLDEAQNKQGLLRSREAIRQSRRVYIFKEKQDKSLQAKQKLGIENFQKFIYNQNMRRVHAPIFIVKIYQSLYYSTELLKGPSQQQLRQKKVSLDLKFPNKKLLLLGLSETIIHSKQNKNQGLKKLKLDVQIFFRPFLIQFLRKMKQLYNIYIFSSSVQEFCNQVMFLINKDQQLIQGVLHRDNCLSSKNGLKIKDLRIIANVPLSNIIIIDNKVHSFGLQLENGIPILQYQGNKNDSQLVHFTKLLTMLSGSEDVRQGIKKIYKLRKIAKISIQLIEKYAKNLRNTYQNQKNAL